MPSAAVADLVNGVAGLKVAGSKAPGEVMVMAVMFGEWLRGPRLLGLAAACAGPVLYALWVRPRLVAWGATPDEVAGAYPGDELIPDANHSSTMAATLPAPPERVWPWLVQMGGDRAGWYSWDGLDHGGEPSADRIVPEWQNLVEGQRLNSLPGGQNWMTVAVLEPNRTLVLRSNYELPSGHTFDPRSVPLPWVFVDAIWGFHLRPAAGGRTRLVVRKLGRGPRVFTWPFDLLLGDPLHFIMQTRQFHNLRARAGSLSPGIGVDRLAGECGHEPKRGGLQYGPHIHSGQAAPSRSA